MAGEHSPGVRLAGRLSRHASIYTVAASASVFAGVLGVAIFTRYLEPAEFGRLAVLSTISSLVTVLANLPTLPGTMRRVYGTSGDEDVGDEGEGEGMSGDPRLSLATGLVLTTLIGIALFAVAWAWQDPLADLLVGDGSDGDLVVLAVGAGAVAAIMRLGRNVVRLQRRPVAYLAITVISTIGGTLVAVPLLQDGLAIEGILIGLMTGHAIAVLITLRFLLADVRAAFSLQEARQIVGAGFYYVPLIISFQTIQLGDTLLVAAFANFRDTGLYRVAQRTASPVAYGTSVFIQSWGPLRRDLVNLAADMQHGTVQLSARVVTHYAVFVSAIALSVAVFADQLVMIAASEYGDAAGLVPLTVLSVAGHGWFVMSYRISTVPRKRPLFLLLAVMAAVVFLSSCVLLIPQLGAVGAPLAGIAAWGTATLVIVAITQTGAEPIPYEYGRLAAIAVLTIGVWAVGYWLLPDTLPGIAAKAAGLVLWLGALVALRVVPVEELHRLGQFMRTAGGEESSRSLRAEVRRLDPGAGELVDQVVRRRIPAAEVAQGMNLSEEEVLAGTIQALRTASGGGPPTDYDVAIGRLLFADRARVEQDLGLRTLVSDGLDPIEADRLVRTVAAVRARRFRAR